MNCRRSHRGQGFTIIELMIVVAIVALVAVLVAPSVQEMILLQRLRGINAQVVTDLQFTRSEAITRGRVGRFNLGSDATQTCYVIYVSDNGVPRCDCTRGAGAACNGTAREIRTVSVPRASAVTLVWPAEQDSAFGYDPVTGGLVSIPNDIVGVPPVSVQIEARIDDVRRLRNTVLQSGRPTVCAPNQQRMGVTAC